MSTKGHNLTTEAREHVAQLRPVLDAENMPTQSVAVPFDDVVLAGTPAGPEERPIAHQRRPSRVVIGAAVFFGLVDVVLLVIAISLGGA